MLNTLHREQPNCTIWWGNLDISLFQREHIFLFLERLLDLECDSHLKFLVSLILHFLPCFMLTSVEKIEWQNEPNPFYLKMSICHMEIEESKKHQGNIHGYPWHSPKSTWRALLKHIEAYLIHHHLLSILIHIYELFYQTPFH